MIKFNEIMKEWDFPERFTVNQLLDPFNNKTTDVSGLFNFDTKNFLGVTTNTDIFRYSVDNLKSLMEKIENKFKIKDYELLTAKGASNESDVFIICNKEDLNKKYIDELGINTTYLGVVVDFLKAKEVELIPFMYLNKTRYGYGVPVCLNKNGESTIITEKTKEITISEGEQRALLGTEQQSKSQLELLSKLLELNSKRIKTSDVNSIIKEVLMRAFPGEVSLEFNKVVSTSDKFDELLSNLLSDYETHVSNEEDLPKDINAYDLLCFLSYKLFKSKDDTYRDLKSNLEMSSVIIRYFLDNHL